MTTASKRSIFQPTGCRFLIHHQQRGNSMESIKLTDLIYAYRMLSEIKKPNPRVSEAVKKLEERILFIIENLKFLGPLPDPPIG